MKRFKKYMCVFVYGYVREHCRCSLQGPGEGTGSPAVELKVEWAARCARNQTQVL